MKVFFINKFLDKHTIYRVPLGILYISAALKKAGHQCFICEPSREDVFKKIRELKPEAVAYSVRTGFHRYYIELNRRLKKEFNFLSIFGGPHATFFPEMISQEGIDAVAMGECEGAMVNLFNKIEARQPFLETKNFWFKTGGEIVKNPLRSLEQDLDKLAFPDRSLFDAYKEIRYSRVHNFISFRGCPYSCAYCFNHRLKQMYAGVTPEAADVDKLNIASYIRKRSVDNLLKEIEQVAEKYNLERVHFEDDTFNMDKTWLKEFVKKYPKIPFKCNIRANLVDEQVVKMLKEAGCISVTFGIEAGNDRIRNEILKRNMSKEQIINCARLLKEYKIRFITENILANPTSSLTDDIETLDLNIKCQPDYPTVSLLQPYPRTEICQIALRAGQFDDRDIDELESFFKTSPLKISEKIERSNLQKLFAIIVAFPFLRKFLNFLISRKRLGPLYSFLYSLWRPWCLVTKIMPHRLSLREFFWLVRRYLTK